MLGESEFYSKALQCAFLIIFALLKRQACAVVRTMGSYIGLPTMHHLEAG